MQTTSSPSIPCIKKSICGIMKIEIVKYQQNNLIQSLNTKIFLKKDASINEYEIWWEEQQNSKNKNKNSYPFKDNVDRRVKFSCGGCSDNGYEGSVKIKKGTKQIKEINKKSKFI